MKDFDAFLREVEQQTNPFRLFGVDYFLPPSPPALAVLKLLRLRSAGVVEETAVLETFRLLFSNVRRADGQSEDVVSVWLEKGLSLAGMMELLRWALDVYGLNGEGGEGKK